MQFYQEASCPFCAIADGRAPAHLVQEWLTAVAFVPLNPVTEGHTLIVPKRHMTRPSDSRDAYKRLNGAAGDWADAQGTSYNLILNQGADATQTVPHLHLHYVPRHPNDGLLLPWSNQYSLHH